MQQGEPEAPLGSCLAVRESHQSLKSELVIGYLDDDVLAGDVSDVTSDLKLLRERYANSSLELNIAKCEFFVVGGTSASRQLACDSVSLETRELIFLWQKTSSIWIPVD